MVHLVLPRCAGASVAQELAAELVQAAARLHAAEALCKLPEVAQLLEAVELKQRMDALLAEEGGAKDVIAALFGRGVGEGGGAESRRVQCAAPRQHCVGVCDGGPT